MQAKKCDRCGAFYTENKARCYGNNRSLKVVYGVAKVTSEHIYGQPATASQIDLCDNCLDSFDNWVKTGENARKINEKE